MPQLHVPMNPRLYQNLKIAIQELGYAGFCEWGRDMARRTIERARREAEESTNRSKDIHQNEKRSKK